MLWWCISYIFLGGSSLKDESANVLIFWNLLIGFTILLPTTFILEKPFISDSINDIFFCIGHSLAAYFGTIFHVLANQMLEMNTLTMLTTVRLPLAFLVEETFLKDVVPVKSVYLLVIGTINTSLTSVATPVCEIWLFLRNHARCYRCCGPNHPQESSAFLIKWLNRRLIFDFLLNYIDLPSLTGVYIINCCQACQISTTKGKKSTTSNRSTCERKKIEIMEMISQCTLNN